MDDKGYWYFDERDRKRLAMAAVFCGKTLESQILYSESQMDPLTGLKNRRGFEEYYAKGIQTVLDDTPCSVIMGDIDFFKKVNDVYGHNAGDVVLKYVAAVLREMTGKQGEVIRWGGEEFVILLRDCDIEKAADLAEQIRQRVETSICYFEDTPIRITMSFGVSAMTAAKSSEQNIKDADQKLYQAKTTGRNRVVTAG
jgi:diguanylate cyclase (GGDEF)-like protein